MAHSPSYDSRRRSALRQRQIDVIIREPWEFGGAVAAATLGIPCVLHGIGALANVEEVISIAEGRLTQHAAGLDVADLWDWLGGAVYIDPCPPVLQSTSATFRPPSRQLVRPQVFDNTDGPLHPPSWLTEPRDRPLIYVGLGTVMNRWHGLLHRLVAEVARLDVEVAVTTGPGFDPADLGDQPANVHVERYVPLTTLLPHCEAVVCHAGWGTTIAAVAHGLPIVAIPLGADGPRTAARCEQSGIGRVVQVDEVGSGRLADELADVMTMPGFRNAAQAARREIEHMPPPPIAIRALEALSP